ncbi:prealbumin-like fold domain-containing protein [Lacticaseibacillus kribbianus]|uniref:prealbumin-like fold domain-containing protein n=1 Tax=Lacticaseibacillus kribbianus TaxID=2926292 RepID=UPI001CD2926E|nr:prealbumin-like fold domain-containing protein [Lacticaseibacillus kribbianus]
MRRMLRLAITLLIGVAVGLGLRGHPVAASTTVTVHPPSAVASRGHPRFTAYDITSYVAKREAAGETLAELRLRLQGADARRLRQFVANHHLEVAASGTESLVVPSANRDYLLLQDTPATLDFAGYARTLAVIVEVTPTDGVIEAYPKPVTEAAAVYFYKYATLVDGTKTPLAGARFALTRTHRGARQYLSTAGGWVTSTQPLTDARVKKVRSDASGAVLLDRVRLPAGTYVFREVQSPQGFMISAKAKNVVVRVTTTDIWVNGHRLRNLLDGHIQAGEAARVGLRVYNPQRPAGPPGKDTTPPTPTPSTPGTTTPNNPHSSIWPHLPITGGWLPQTGEARSAMAILGIVIIGIALYFWFHTKTNKREKQ